MRLCKQECCGLRPAGSCAVAFATLSGFPAACSPSSMGIRAMEVSNPVDEVMRNLVRGLTSEQRDLVDRGRAEDAEVPTTRTPAPLGGTPRAPAAS